MGTFGNVLEKLKENDNTYREVSLYRLAYLLYHGLIPVKVETFDEDNAMGCKHYFYFEYSEELGRLLQLYKGGEFDKYNSTVNHVFTCISAKNPGAIISGLEFLKHKTQ